MKKVIITVLAVFLSVIIVLLSVVGYEHCMPKQFGNTYLAGMSMKYQRLKSVNDKKIVLVGGSNVPFGIDSRLIESHLPDYKVVNLGLYAALGSKTTMDLSKANIRSGDIVIFVGEYSPQMYSKYINPEIMLQMLESDRSMLFNIPAGDMFSLIGAYPNYIGQKSKFIENGTTPNPKDVYAKSSFNAYGDIVYPRPYNVMPDMYDGVNLIDINSNIISGDFVNYFNDYADWVRRKNASIYISFPPVNESALVEDCTFEKRLEFYDYINKNFKAHTMSNIEDYIIHQDYFYDTNYHLNDTGVILRTANLINDIKRIVGDFSATDIVIPPGSGADPGSGEDVEDNESDNELAKDFVYELQNNKQVITGVSDLGKTKTSLKIPETINGIAVYKISARAFENCQTVTTLNIAQSVRVLEDNLFDGARNLVTVNLNIDNNSQSLPTVGQSLTDGCNQNLKIFVPFINLSQMKVDYFWGVYSPRLFAMD